MTEDQLSNRTIAYYQNHIYRNHNRLTGMRTYVYKGQHNSNTLAIKCYKNYDALKEKIKTEIETIDYLSQFSDYFPKYYGSFTEPESVYIAMEFADNNMDEVYTHVKNSNGKFSENELNGIIKCILEGFLYMIEVNMYHRNVSLKNFVYIRADQKVKIIDFSDTLILAQMENSSMCFPLPKAKEYLAPELLFFHTKKTTDEQEFQYSLEKADVFSLGLVLLQLCTLKDFSHWENSFSEEDIKNAIFEIQFPFIKQLLKAMLNYDPKERKNFKRLAECFSAPSLAYPIGSLEIADHIEGMTLILSQKDGIEEYSALYQNKQIDIKIFNSVDPLQKKKCDAMSFGLSEFSGRLPCFLKFYCAFENNYLIWLIIEHRGIKFSKVREELSKIYYFFSEQDLAIYFTVLVKGLEMCHSSGIFFNNINPSTIYFNSNAMMVFDSFNLPFLSRTDEFNRTISLIINEEIPEENSYLAPEIIEDIAMIANNEGFSVSYNKSCADIYSLGLVFYEMATLQKSTGFNMKLNSVSVQSKLNMIEIPWIQRVIKGMIDYSPECRLTPQQILEILPQTTLGF
ncbi:hypothetical protein SteCoe_36369 [Stentor coeruleus]|uniref:Protein kinase domain-containing protein n=1 Tax=Stentor coeruleus TaxID=5963 RepID=A0A1R2AQL8_9CILI|nr:hypothetical protein SteCoe_36369 [Stentor coeruleus]